MNKAEWYTIVTLRGDDDSPDPSNASEQSKSKGRQCEDVNGSISRAAPLDDEWLGIVLATGRFYQAH